MSILSSIKYYYFKNIYFKKYIKLVYQNRHQAVACQQAVFENLIKNGAKTAFGKEHHFSEIKNIQDFENKVPVRSYEDLLPYFTRVLERESDVLWPGISLYFARSSGTTNGSKYIPLTAAYLKSTQYAARYMIANLVDHFGNTGFIKGKLFYQADPPIFENKNGFRCASVSAIKSSRMPGWARLFSLPGKAVDGIENLEEKLQKTIEILLRHDVRSAVALPVWLSQLLIQVEKITGKKFKEHFPYFNILFLSGMNYEPYENLLRQHMGRHVIIMENYSATEGNFAYQAVPGVKGMELICNQGIFYEFILLENSGIPDPERITLKNVQMGLQYIMVISGTCGLWAYKLNDIVSFVSVDPYRICVSGRLQDILSPFGEHLLPVQAERAMGVACRKTNTSIVDFVIFPDFNFEKGHRYLCYIEFDDLLPEVANFAKQLHDELSKENSYYDEFKRAGIFVTPKIIPLRKSFFKEFNKGTTVQQKNRHLSNNTALLNLFKLNGK